MFEQNLEGKNVFVGLSGGVDSSVAAALLKKQGANVTGVYMKNWSGEDYSLNLNCPWEEEQAIAESVCKALLIPFRSYNFEKEYSTAVLSYFFSEYEKGRTPNPDILCNSEIKFKAFLAKAESEGADFIATGHYAGIRFDNSNNNSEPLLLNARDINKDQTYFLSGLTASQLKKSLFPLANLTKPEVRLLAKELNLPNFARKDSQGICFVGNIDVQEFLRKHLKKNPGDIIDIDTKKIVGKHEGLSFYTIGQRQGLKIGGIKKAYYVCKKDILTNQLYVAMGNDNPALYARQVKFSNLHWINGTPSRLSNQLNNSLLFASVRYRSPKQVGVLTFDSNNEGIFEFNENQRAIAPGQSLVFYSEDVCLGRATIE